MKKTPQEKKQFDRHTAQIAKLVDQKLALEAEINHHEVIQKELALAASKLLRLIDKMTHRFTYEEFEAYTEEVEAEFVAHAKKEKDAARAPITHES